MDGLITLLISLSLAGLIYVIAMALDKKQETKMAIDNGQKDIDDEEEED